MEILWCFSLHHTSNLQPGWPACRLLDKNWLHTNFTVGHTKISIHLYPAPSRNDIVSQLLPNQIIKKNPSIPWMTWSRLQEAGALATALRVCIFRFLCDVLGATSSKTWGFNSLRCSLLWRLCWCFRIELELQSQILLWHLGLRKVWIQIQARS